IARLFHLLGDCVKHPIPALFFPMIGTGSAIERFSQTRVIDNIVLERDAFGAERAAIDRMIRIALDVDHCRACHILRSVAERVYDDAATDCAVWTGRTRFGGARDLQLTHGRVCQREIETESERSHAANRSDFQKISSRNSHMISSRML